MLLRAVIEVSVKGHYNTASTRNFCDLMLLQKGSVMLMCTGWPTLHSRAPTTTMTQGRIGSLIYIIFSS